LDQVLPARNAIAKVQHRAALPWSEIASFMADLRDREGIAARALEYAILTTTRTGEVLGACWEEIDFDTATWTIPSSRMKATREHRVPLSEPALALLRTLPVEDGNDYVFIGAQVGRGLGDKAMHEVLARMERTDITVHGFRSTFRDWAAEATSHPNHVAEKALAHKVPNAVEAAYRRGDLFEKRRVLMQDWAIFCADGARVVVPMRRSVP
jgi:integrase